MTFFEKNEENLEAIVFSLSERKKTTIAVCVYDCDDTCNKAMEYLNQQFSTHKIVFFDLFGQKIDSLLAFFRAQLPKDNQQNLPIVHLTQLDPLLFTSKNYKVISSPLVEQINMERELLFNEVEGLIILWLTKGGYNRLRMDAPDFMDWVVASFVFENEGDVLNQKLSFVVPQETINDRSNAEIHLLQEKAEQLEQRTHKFQQGTRLTIKDQKEYFNLLLSLIEAYKNLHDLSNAQSTLKKAYTLAKENKLANGFEFGYLLVNWGDIESDLCNLSKALALFEEAFQYFKILEDKANESVCLGRLGQTHKSLGNLDKALYFFEKNNELSRHLCEVYPANVEFKNRLGLSYNHLGVIHTILGSLEKGLEFFIEYYKLELKLYEAYPLNVDYKNGLAISYNQLGETYATLGDLEKALVFFYASNKIEKELFEAHPTNVNFKSVLATSYLQLGKMHKILNAQNKMLDSYKNSNQLFKELFKIAPKNIDFKCNLMESYFALIQFYIKADKIQAKAYFMESEILWEKLIQDVTHNLRLQQFLEKNEGLYNSLQLGLFPKNKFSFFNLIHEFFSWLYSFFLKVNQPRPK